MEYWETFDRSKNLETIQPQSDTKIGVICTAVIKKISTK